MTVTDDVNTALCGSSDTAGEIVHRKTGYTLVTLSMSEAGADVMNSFKQQQQQHAPPLSVSTGSMSKRQSGLQKSGCDAKETEM